MTAASIITLEAVHLASLRAFFDRLPERDVTFIKEDVRDPAVAEGWVRSPGAARHSVALASDRVDGLVRLVPLTGWSSHVGSLRVVVAPSARGRGLGEALTGRALREAAKMGLAKLVVEVVAEQEDAVQMFVRLGFRSEALLTSYIRDRAGRLQDLLLLAHDISEEWSALASLGVHDDLA